MIEPQPLEPDQIIWNNLKYTKQDQAIRSFIVFLISILVAIFSIVATLFFQGQSERLKKYKIDCTEVDTGPENVFIDQISYNVMRTKMLGEKAGEDQELSDSMLCFCQMQTVGGTQPWLASSELFLAFSKDEIELPNYCVGYLLIRLQT